MSRFLAKGFLSLVPAVPLICSSFAAAQDPPKVPLLRLQQAMAELGYNPGPSGHVSALSNADVWRYPNSSTCLVVYADGKYVYEKRDEHTLGKPKARQAEGQFPPPELTQVKEMLDDDHLRSVTSLPIPNIPSDALDLRAIETLNVQIDHGGRPQQFTTVKARVRTRGVFGVTSSAAIDTELDSGSTYAKALAPLLKWFKEVGKKSNGALKDADPQDCGPASWHTASAPDSPGPPKLAQRDPGY